MIPVTVAVDEAGFENRVETMPPPPLAPEEAAVPAPLASAGAAAREPRPNRLPILLMMPPPLPPVAPASLRRRASCALASFVSKLTRMSLDSSGLPLLGLCLS